MNPRPRAVLRSAVRAVNTPFAKARLARAVRSAPRPIKLEIGGLTRRPGWLITNVNATTGSYLDATARWPIEDGAVAYVYADNVIEHIQLDAGRALLAEAHRCMQPGGVIRLITPDIRTHVELYLAGPSSLDSAAGRHYRDMGLTVEHPIDLVRIPIGSFGHHTGYVYDFDTLDLELKRAGFHSTVRCELNASEHAALAGLDLRGHEGGAQIAVEAIR
ncbi:MAG: class I SAM-dependent methyltransferase [Jatrophihabitantaceae bacterium]